MDCLQFDMSTVDFENRKGNGNCSERIEMMNNVVKSDVESMKPHIVYIQHLQEGHYIMKLKMMLNRMGYESMFQPTHNGRGQATFIRYDIVPDHQESVFKSSMPDPCSWCLSRFRHRPRSRNCATHNADKYCQWNPIRHLWKNLIRHLGIGYGIILYIETLS